MEGHEGPVASHAEVLEAVGQRAVQMQTLAKQIVAALNRKILKELPDLTPVSLKVPSKFWPLTSKLVAVGALVAAGAVIGTVMTKR